MFLSVEFGVEGKEAAIFILFLLEVYCEHLSPVDQVFYHDRKVHHNHFITLLLGSKQKPC